MGTEGADEDDEPLEEEPLPAAPPFGPSVPLLNALRKSCILEAMSDEIRLLTKSSSGKKKTKSLYECRLAYYQRVAIRVRAHRQRNEPNNFAPLSTH